MKAIVLFLLIIVNVSRLPCGVPFKVQPCAGKLWMG
jgi:hypothetical protein